jgi:hypothetical protein
LAGFTIAVKSHIVMKACENAKKKCVKMCKQPNKSLVRVV